jgi:hypothetical protein
MWKECTNFGELKFLPPKKAKILTNHPMFTKIESLRRLLTFHTHIKFHQDTSTIF